MALEFQHLVNGEEISGATNNPQVYDPVGGEHNGEHTVRVTDSDTGRSETFGPVTITVQGGIGSMVVGTDFTIG